MGLFEAMFVSFMIASWTVLFFPFTKASNLTGIVAQILIAIFLNVVWIIIHTSGL